MLLVVVFGWFPLKTHGSPHDYAENSMKMRETKQNEINREIGVKWDYNLLSAVKRPLPRCIMVKFG